MDCKTANPTLAAMRHYGAPETREVYLNWAYLGNPPDELDPEEESLLPEKFQRAYLLDAESASKKKQ